MKSFLRTLRVCTFLLLRLICQCQLEKVVAMGDRIEAPASSADYLYYMMKRQKV